MLLLYKSIQIPSLLFTVSLLRELLPLGQFLSFPSLHKLCSTPLLPVRGGFVKMVVSSYGEHLPGSLSRGQQALNENLLSICWPGYHKNGLKGLPSHIAPKGSGAGCTRDGSCGWTWKAEQDFYTKRRWEWCSGGRPRNVRSLTVRDAPGILGFRVR